MQIKENISLRKYNTFGVEAIAKYFVEINNENDIHKIIDTGLIKDNKFYILGAGSNTLFADDYDGAILKINLKGMKYIQVKEDHNIVEVAAGEKWHDFVAIMNKNNLFGMENLAYIPGDLGAAPIQNIGAFGVEQKDLFHSLSSISLDTNKEVSLDYNDCRFGYRDSIFKHDLKNKHIITKVRYILKKEQVLNFKYSLLSKEINKFGIENPDSQYIFDTIIRLRQKRLPDFKKIGNAGSFFKNPIITKEDAQKLSVIYPGLPVFRESDTHKKIPAAYLIEKAGWKGKRNGDVGVYENHALIIVNYGNASGKDILNFANDIIADIHDKYNIKLESEVVILN